MRKVILIIGIIALCVFLASFVTAPEINLDDYNEVNWTDRDDFTQVTSTPEGLEAFFLIFENDPQQRNNILRDVLPRISRTAGQRVYDRLEPSHLSQFNSEFRDHFDIEIDFAGQNVDYNGESNAIRNGQGAILRLGTLSGSDVVQATVDGRWMINGRIIGGDNVGIVERDGRRLFEVSAGGGSALLDLENAPNARIDYDPNTRTFQNLQNMNGATITIDHDSTQPFKIDNKDKHTLTIKIGNLAPITTTAEDIEYGKNQEWAKQFEMPYDPKVIPSGAAQYSANRNFLRLEGDDFTWDDMQSIDRGRYVFNLDRAGLIDVFVENIINPVIGPEGRAGITQTNGESTLRAQQNFGEFEPLHIRIGVGDIDASSPGSPDLIVDQDLTAIRERDTDRFDVSLKASPQESKKIDYKRVDFLGRLEQGDIELDEEFPVETLSVPFTLPEDLYPRQSQVDQLRQRGDLRSAIDILNQELERNPTNVNILNQLALLNGEIGNTEEAERLQNQLMDTYSQNMYASAGTEDVYFYGKTDKSQSVQARLQAEVDGKDVKGLADVWPKHKNVPDKVVLVPLELDFPDRKAVAKEFNLARNEWGNDALAMGQAPTLEDSGFDDPVLAIWTDKPENYDASQLKKDFSLILWDNPDQVKEFVDSGQIKLVIEENTLFGTEYKVMKQDNVEKFLANLKKAYDAKWTKKSQ